MATNDTEDVKIVVSADTTGLTSGLNKAKNNVQNFENSAKQAGDKVDNLGNKAKQAGDKVKDVGNAGGSGFGKLGSQIGIASGAMSGLMNMAVKAGQAIAQALAKSVLAASDFNENMSKTQVVFGNYADEYIGKSKKMAATTGLSANQYLEQMSLWGAMAKAMGIPTDKMREMSEQLTQLSADMASFHNKDVEQVRTALKGVFTGETEALKEFGVVMTETNLEKFAADHGQVYKSMSQAEKVMLRYNFVLDQQKLALGDYQRTNQGFANSFRTLKSNIENAMIGIGQKILPPIENVMNKVNVAFKALNTSHEDLGQEMTDSKTRMAELVQKAQELKDKGMENTDEWQRVQEAMDGEASLQQTIQSADAIKSKFEEMQPFIETVMANLKTSIDMLLIPMKIIAQVLIGLFKGIQPWIQPIMDSIIGIKTESDKLIENIFGNKENFDSFLGGIKEILETIGFVVGTVIGGAVWFILEGIKGIIWIINQIIEGIQWLTDKIGEGLDWLGQKWDETIGAWIGWLWGKLQELWSWFQNFPENVQIWWGNMCDWLTNKWNEFLDWVKNIDIVEMFFGALKNIGTWLDNNVLQPIKDWFKNIPSKIGGAIGSAASSIWDTIKGWVGFNLNPTQEVQGYLNLMGGSTPNDGNSYSRTQVYNFNYNLQHAPSNSFISNQKAAVESGAMYGLFNNGSWR